MQPSTITLPALNEGEHYAGLILNEDGTPRHHLILLTGDNDRDTWKKQMVWAKKQGGELPTCQEQSLLFANCKKNFAGNWYWSGKQYAAHSGYAWSQTFYDGAQGCFIATIKCRARAVRRLPI